MAQNYKWEKNKITYYSYSKAMEYDLKIIDNQSNKNKKINIFFFC